jgi:hypothetical protein
MKSAEPFPKKFGIANPAQSKIVEIREKTSPLPCTSSK